MTTMIKMSKFKIFKRGHRGRGVTLPAVWIEDNELDAGDYIYCYRDSEDRLIITPAEKGNKQTCTTGA